MTVIQDKKNYKVSVNMGWFERLIYAIEKIGAPAVVTLLLIYYIFVKADRQIELLIEINNKMDRPNRVESIIPKEFIQLKTINLEVNNESLEDNSWLNNDCSGISSFWNQRAASDSCTRMVNDYRLCVHVSLNHIYRLEYRG